MNFALEAKAASGAHKGWISVGFSKAGKMTGSDAVIGNLPRPNVIGPYYMGSIVKSSVTRTNKFAITKTSVVTNPQGTIMKFTRSGPKGTVPVKYTGKNFILWAYSATGKSKALDNHSPMNRGAVSINLGCKSSAASALVTELVDFAASCRLDYTASLVAESASACSPSVGGECALGTDVLEDRQEEFQCLAAASPHLASVLLAPEGDPDALDISTPRSYAEAIEGPYSSQWQAAMDAEMASWRSKALAPCDHQRCCTQLGLVPVLPHLLTS
ncbi:unnamed protein product [Closterium sp. NIES-54]